MKVLIITVAGMSTRFSESIGREYVKCLYYEEDPREALLYQLLHQNDSFDKYIIVGGFRYEELKQAVEASYTDLKDRILLLENTEYARYGSGYSLYLGMKKALEMQAEEIVFAEGDLFLERAVFTEIVKSEKPVVTINQEPINARKSVVFYYDTSYGIHYLYDTAHNELEIKEPFVEIYNSGQVWKFVGYPGIKDVVGHMDVSEWYGTNLVFVQKYFSQMRRADYEIMTFRQWINCNTVQDFRRMLKDEGE